MAKERMVKDNRTKMIQEMQKVKPLKILLPPEERKANLLRPNRRVIHDKQARWT